MKENWQKENLEKTKEVLIEHFERRKQERMLKEMDMAFRPQYTTIELHSGTSWDIDQSEFYDNLIWDYTPIEKKPFFKKLKDNIVLAYYGFLLILWRIKQKKKRG